MTWLKHAEAWDEGWKTVDGMGGEYLEKVFQVGVKDWGTPTLTAFIQGGELTVIKESDEEALRETIEDVDSAKQRADQFVMARR